MNDKQCSNRCGGKRGAWRGKVSPRLHMRPCYFVCPQRVIAASAHAPCWLESTEQRNFHGHVLHLRRVPPWNAHTWSCSRLSQPILKSNAQSNVVC